MLWYFGRGAFVRSRGLHVLQDFRELTLLPLTTRRNLSVSSPVNKISKAPNIENDEDDLDKPIKFTTSKASKLSAKETLGGNPFPNAPWYQPYVVSFSVGIFLLYFLALREENDMDEYIGKPLWEKVPGLEKQQLLVVLDYNRAHNLDTKEIENRLEELERQSQQQAQHSNS